MRRYEVVFVLAPTLPQEEIQQTAEIFSNAAKEMGADILRLDEWGKRRLAFPVKKFNQGMYMILTLEEEAAVAVKELERRFRVTDSVIRYLTIRVDQEIKVADKLKARRTAKRRKRHQKRDAADAVAS